MREARLQFYQGLGSGEGTGAHVVEPGSCLCLVTKGLGLECMCAWELGILAPASLKA